MDDTLWVADNRDKLSKIIDIASSFYKMARITVNSDKSTLITRTNDQVKSIVFNNA